MVAAVHAGLPVAEYSARTVKQAVVGNGGATKEQVHEAMQYVPDEFVLKISATGTPAEARAKVQEYIDRGCTCPILYPMSDPYLMIDTFATV